MSAQALNLGLDHGSLSGNTIRRPVICDAQGGLIISGGGASPNTYTAHQLFTPVSAKDVMWLPGSATKTIRVLRWTFSGIATAAAVIAVSLNKRSAIATGTFTATALSPVGPLDSQGAAATALPVYVSADTSLVAGTGLGVPFFAYLSLSTVGGGIAQMATVIEFGKNAPPVNLRGVAENLALNLGAVPAGISIISTVMWVEE